MFSAIKSGLGSLGLLSSKAEQYKPGSSGLPGGGAGDIDPARGRLGAWLPYRHYDSAAKVFFNRESIGFCLELAPQTGADQGMVDTLKGVYSSMPDFTTVQYQLFASPHITDVLKRYANMRQADIDAADQSAQKGRPVRNTSVTRVMARRRYAYLQRGAMKSLVPGLPILVRNFRLVVSVTVPGNILNREKLEDLLNTRDQMTSAFQSAGYPNVIWGAEELINWTADLTNAQRLFGDNAWLGYDDQQEINEQIVFNDTYTNWMDPKRGLIVPLGDESKTLDLRMLSVRKYPKEFALWNMGSLVGDVYQAGLQIPCPFLITLGVQLPDQQAEKTGALANSIKAQRDATSDLAKLSPGMVEKAEEWSVALKALQSGGKMTNSFMQVALFAPPEQAKRCENAIRDLWRARGFELQLDVFKQLEGFINSLPMTLSQKMVEQLSMQKRVYPKTSGNVTHLAPMISGAKGTLEAPVLIGVERRGQIVGLDLWRNTQGGKNVSIVGSIGSGKSSLLEEIASSYYATGAKVRVFEKGRSFERLTARLQGQFLRFTSASRICVNPFGMVSDPVEIDGEMCGGIDDDVAMLQPLLAKMASPNRELDPTIYATLATVIKEEYVKRGRLTTITDIQARYAAGRLYEDRAVDQRYLDMADMLAPFCKGGPYQHWFDGPPTLNFDNDFMVFEMQDLERNPHLYSVIQMILLYKVSQEMLEERHRRKMFIMDEARDGLGGDGEDDKVMANFIDKLYLRIRKYNGSAVTATQDVAHYYASKAGASVFNQSDFIFMGRQSESSIASASKSENFVMDEALKRLLGTLGGSEGNFKEWYVHSPIYKGVLRLFIDPGTLLLFSNRAEDNTPIDERLERGMSIEDAIADLLLERGISV
jgi:conjugal transfer ATP-binding protein TraC